MSFMQRIFGTAQQPQQQGPMMDPNTGLPMQQQQGSITTMPQPAMISGDPHKPNMPTETQTQAEKEPASPMGEWAELWTMEQPKPGEADPNAPFRFNVDPAKVQQQVGRIDFTKSITPELLAKINAGGPEATAALLTAMNTIGQQVMVQSSLVNTKILESGLDASSTRMESKLPGLVRNQSISNALREDNPLFTNPATAPMLEAISSQMAAKFPNATPAEIRENAKKYLIGFAQEAQSVYKVEPNGTPQNNKANMSEYDWSQEPT